MTRYRKPQPPASSYSTPEGAKKLRDELDELWRVQRPQVTRAVQEAAAQGDRSENAEYTYGKRQLREIDRRVRFLRKRLEAMVVVSQPPDDRSRVFFGAWVRLEDDDGVQTEFRIVGPDEIDPARRHVSMDAPLSRALLGKRLDQEVSVEVPGGHRTYVIVQVRYEQSGQGDT
ncbi:MAG: transcription elongation factor GreB [Steroidobacteraceae bacterium]